MGGFCKEIELAWRESVANVENMLKAKHVVALAVMPHHCFGSHSLTEAELACSGCIKGLKMTFVFTFRIYLYLIVIGQ